MAENLQRLSAASSVLVYNGGALDLKKSPKDFCMASGAKVLAMAALTESQISMQVGGRIRVFKRFRDVKNDGWYIGRDRWDAVTFIPTRNVVIRGVLIFEPYQA
jgi:hypothetical protein